MKGAQREEWCGALVFYFHDDGCGAATTTCQPEEPENMHCRTNAKGRKRAKLLALSFSCSLAALAATDDALATIPLSPDQGRAVNAPCSPVAESVHMADTTNIRLVRVVSREGEVVTELSAAAELEQFQEIWSGKTQMPKESWRSVDYASFSYSLYISTDTDSGIWRFDPAGYVTPLSKMISPIYRIDEAEVIRHLLGIPDQ